MKIIYLKTGRFTQQGLFLYQIQNDVQVVKQEKSHCNKNGHVGFDEIVQFSNIAIGQ